LYTGFISNVVWNAATNYFTNDPGQNFNIAIGNTSGEALSALIANTSGFPPEQVAVVEEILDALPAGILPQATSDSMLNDWEELKETLHKKDLGGGYFLTSVTAPRYWQPNNSVLLFQGDGIQPSDRYGNDGRYMAVGTLVCRLTGQLLTAVKIPAGAYGNVAELDLDASAFAPIPNFEIEQLSIAFRMMDVNVPATRQVFGSLYGLFKIGDTEVFPLRPASRPVRLSPSAHCDRAPMPAGQTRPREFR
jgi:hypothetical protein